MMLNQCYCCLLRPPATYLKTPYKRFGMTEIYSEMLKECFKIHLFDSGNEGGICDVCVGRLQDACDFKLQVQRSQAELQARLERACHVKKESSVKSEQSECHADELHYKVKSEWELLPEGEEERPREDCELKSENEDVIKDGEVSKTCPSLGLGRSHAEQMLPIEFPATIDHDAGVMTHSSGQTGWTREDIDFDAYFEDTTDNVVAKSKKHVRRLTTWPVFCKICSKPCHSKYQFDEHTVIHAGEKLYACNTCQWQFDRRNQLIRHAKTHTYNKPFRCDVCNKMFKTSANLKQHKLLHKGDLSCGECNKRFISRTELKIHKRVHARDKYCCDICGKGLISSVFLRKHKLSHNTENCDICNKQYSSRKGLCQHMTTHGDMKLYSCEICKKQYADKSLLDAHKRIHNRKRKFCCEICGNQFLSNSLLNSHKLLHTGEKPYACDICNKRFRIKTGLIVHMRGHTGVKPFSCEVCEKKFSDPSGFRRHKVSHKHKDERPSYACEICNKQFRFKHKLSTHRLIHTGEKPHSCDVCGKQFRAKNNLKTHLATHEKGQSYSCEICRRTYSTKESLRQHSRGHRTAEVKPAKLKSAVDSSAN